MSAAADALLAFPETAARERSGRHLRPVARVRRRRPRVAYALVALGGALAIAAAQMGLSIATTESSYRVQKLTQTQSELTWKKQELTDKIAGLSSPQYLAANAASLGMVINQSPLYLRLGDGKILGVKKSPNYISSVNALGKGAVANSLVADTPLVTAPGATIKGATDTADKDASAKDAGAALPPPITDGLPTPTTR